MQGKESAKQTKPRAAVYVIVIGCVRNQTHRIDLFFRLPSSSLPLATGLRAEFRHETNESVEKAEIQLASRYGGLDDDDIEDMPPNPQDDSSRATTAKSGIPEDTTTEMRRDVTRKNTVRTDLFLSIQTLTIKGHLLRMSLCFRQPQIPSLTILVEPVQHFNPQPRNLLPHCRRLYSLLARPRNQVARKQARVFHAAMIPRRPKAPNLVCVPMSRSCPSSPSMGTSGYYSTIHHCTILSTSRAIPSRGSRSHPLNSPRSVKPSSTPYILRPNTLFSYAKMQ